MDRPTSGLASSQIQLPIAALVHTEPAPTSPEEHYLDLLKRTLTRTLVARARERHTLAMESQPFKLLISIAYRLLAPLQLELVRTWPCNEADFMESGDATNSRVENSESMVGLRQFDNMQRCIADVLERGVEGDFLEAGVWRGGMTIFMRAALEIHGDREKTVWVSDSFEGLPEPDRAVETDGWWWRRGHMAASLEAVRGNFARYGLLDDRVVFLKGFFADTLPGAPVERLSILRFDGDLYSSAMDVMTALYPKLSVGGYMIVDDYVSLPDCRRAIDEYRASHGITEEIHEIDSRAVYWKRLH